MDRADTFDGLRLDHDPAFNEHIEARRCIAEKTFAGELPQFLMGRAEVAQFEFAEMASLVDRLGESRSFVPMNLNCSGNDVPGKTVGLREKRVHRCPCFLCSLLSN